MTTIRIKHPAARLLHETGRGVADTYVDVVSGDWGAIAEVCSDKVLHLDDAKRTLASESFASGHTFPGRDGLAMYLSDGLDDGDYVLVVGGEKGLGLAISALDLFMRLMCGQWDRADFECRMTAETCGDLDPFRLNWVRGRICRTFEPRGRRDYRPLEPDEFPAHPSASVGIAQAPKAARVAYHAYKRLGAGAPGGPTFSVDGAEVHVLVDGEPTNRIKEY